jgi:chemotaxis protein CheD
MVDSDNMIVVNMGDAKFASSPSVLKTCNLGSCVAVMLYSKVDKKGVMDHVMLPYSDDYDISNPYKFANVGVDMIVKKLISDGVNKLNLVAKLAGGAHMFPTLGEGVMNIGENNILMVKKILKMHGISVIAEDVGKDYGRTVSFDLSTGDVDVSSFKVGLNKI